MSGADEFTGTGLLCVGLLAVIAASGAQDLAVIAGLGVPGLVSMALGVRRINKEDSE